MMVGTLEMGQTAEITQQIGVRIKQALEQRLRPRGELSLTAVSRAADMSRFKLREIKDGKRDVSLTDICLIDRALSRAGEAGFYQAVTSVANGRWQDERLSLDEMNDVPRREFLRAFRAGGDPIEVAGKMALLPHATILVRQGNDFVSMHIGTELPVDQSLRWRKLLDRADADYAGLVDMQMRATLGEPTLYRLKSRLHSYTRLAVPGRGCVLTLPFDTVVPQQWKVR